MTTINDRMLALIAELVDGGVTLSQACEAFERRYVATAIKQANGNITVASRKLGVHRNTLHNRSWVSEMCADVRSQRRAARREGRGGV